MPGYIDTRGVVAYPSRLSSVPQGPYSHRQLIVDAALHSLGLEVRSRLVIAMMILVAAFILPGCTVLLSTPPPSDVKSFLKAVETAPDSVTLEIFHVRLPAADRELDEELWQAVDEQSVDVGLRRRLVRNGFRVGVLGGALPDGLARQLNLQSELPEVSSERVITDQSANPTVVRRVLQLNRHESATIQSSDLHDKLHVLFATDSGLQGHSYRQAQASFSLRAAAAPGQRITVELNPELHHGEMRNRYAGSDQGIFMVTPSRERESYEQLNLKIELAPGELLIVSCLPDASGSLGNVFHSQSHNGPTEHKIVLVRMLEVPRSEILANVE